MMKRIITAAVLVMGFSAGSALAAVGYGEYTHDAIEGNLQGSTFETTVLDVTAFNFRSDDQHKLEQSPSVPGFWGEFKARGSEGQ